LQLSLNSLSLYIPYKATRSDRKLKYKIPNKQSKVAEKGYNFFFEYIIALPQELFLLYVACYVVCALNREDKMNTEINFQVS